MLQSNYWVHGPYILSQERPQLLILTKNILSCAL